MTTESSFSFNRGEGRLGVGRLREYEDEEEEGYDFTESSKGEDSRERLGRSRGIMNINILQ